MKNKGKIEALLNLLFMGIVLIGLLVTFTLMGVSCYYKATIKDQVTIQVIDKDRETDEDGFSYYNLYLQGLNGKEEGVETSKSIYYEVRAGECYDVVIKGKPSWGREVSEILKEHPDC